MSRKMQDVATLDSGESERILEISSSEDKAEQEYYSEEEE